MALRPRDGWKDLPPGQQPLDVSCPLITQFSDTKGSLSPPLLRRSRANTDKRTGSSVLSFKDVPGIYSTIEEPGTPEKREYIRRVHTGVSVTHPEKETPVPNR